MKNIIKMKIILMIWNKIFNSKELFKYWIVVTIQWARKIMMIPAVFFPQETIFFIFQIIKIIIKLMKEIYRELKFKKKIKKNSILL